MEKYAGEKVCFTLTARNRNGDAIRNWNTTGVNVTVTLLNSTANTDTSERSWSADPNAFSWARLSKNGYYFIHRKPDTWTIPYQYFDTAGCFHVCFSCSKAEDQLRFNVWPDTVSSDGLVAPLRYLSTTFDNYLIRVTSQVPGSAAVFVKRPYELVVTARDRYLNPISYPVETRFLARFPNDIDTDPASGGDIFTRKLIVRGTMRTLLVSHVSMIMGRDPLQQIFAISADDARKFNETETYEVLDHAPRGFSLLTPRTGDTFPFAFPFSAKTTTLRWERPDTVDPCFNVRRFENDSATFSDTIRYTVVIVDSLEPRRLMRFSADAQGIAPAFTITDTMAYEIVYGLSGWKAALHYTVYWYVEASDGQYVTLSTPPHRSADPGNYLHFTRTGVVGIQPQSDATHPLRLLPNPTAGSTTIHISTRMTGHIRVSIHDILGVCIGTLLDDFREAGEYSIPFNASQLAPGVYICKLTTDEGTVTRRMTVMR